MRPAVITLASGLLVLLSVAPGRAEGPWYVSGSAGGYQREAEGGPTTITSLSSGFSAPGTEHVTFETGYVLALGVGYRLPFGFRIEGEFAYASYQTSQASPVSTPFGLDGRAFNRASDVSHDRYLMTLNGYYDLPLPEIAPVMPYVGLGMGATVNDNPQRTVFRDAAGGRFTLSSSPTSGGIVQVEAGFGIALSDSVSIVPAYRFIHSFDTGNRFGDENAHVFKVGLRYGF
jgi:opacity protein-like surface antigen